MATPVDTVKAFFTYAIALVVVVGGGALLYLTRADPTAASLQIVVAGFIGSALTFVFGSEVQTRTARQAALATAAAVAANGGHNGR